MTVHPSRRSVIVAVPLLALISALGTEVVADPPSDVPEPSSVLRDAPAAKLSFSFRFAPWKGVLEWLAEQSNLSLQLDGVPKGTFNYVDSQQHTPSEAIDLINRVLLTKGYTLVRRGRMLTVVDLKDEAMPSMLMELVPLVTQEELAERGQFELTKCMFQLRHALPSDVERELRPLLGPHGTMLMIPAARQVLIVETSGKLRMIQRVIEAMERQPERAQPDPLRLRSHSTTPADPTIVFEVMRTLLAGEPGVRLAIDPKTGSLIALATETHHATIKATLQELQRGGLEHFRFRVVPTTSRVIKDRDIKEIIANLQAIWRRDNDIRFVSAAAAQLPPIREITASRLPARRQRAEPGRTIGRSLPDEPGASAPKKPTSEKRAKEPDLEGRLLRLPRGPVRIVPIEGLDLLLIRAGGNW